MWSRNVPKWVRTQKIKLEKKCYKCLKNKRWLKIKQKNRDTIRLGLSAQKPSPIKINKYIIK